MSCYVFDSRCNPRGKPSVLELFSSWRKVGIQATSAGSNYAVLFFYDATVVSSRGLRSQKTLCREAGHRIVSWVFRIESGRWVAANEPFDFNVDTLCQSNDKHRAPSRAPGSGVSRRVPFRRPFSGLKLPIGMPGNAGLNDGVSALPDSDSVTSASRYVHEPATRSLPRLASSDSSAPFACVMTASSMRPDPPRPRRQVRSQTRTNPRQA